VLSPPEAISEFCAAVAAGVRTAAMDRSAASKKVFNLSIGPLKTIVEHTRAHSTLGYIALKINFWNSECWIREFEHVDPSTNHYCSI
jgi:hypothetical protein